ncbi:MAG: hypothetical protein K5905_02515 [Roseibium sp.]|uniref:hypothetical protein n=1 Tax=Roseibium sp. TaxID=1936156 RepID=UPI0026247800|nr:hypothetical protein [Roseibium sp.]MCV0424322.1 hypothetical protein [Roseibium sp.]
MEKSQQKQWFTDLLEGVPSIAFILLWRQGGDLEFAGWVGSGLALGVFAVFRLLRARMHPVLLGVNLHILVATPLIISLFRFGDAAIAKTLVAYSHGGVLLTVLMTGLLLSSFSKGGFAGLPDMPRGQQGRISALMLIVSALGAIWALATPQDSLIPVVVTLMLLIGGRRYLLARWMDRSKTDGTTAVGGLSVGDLSSTELSA